VTKPAAYRDLPVPCARAPPIQTADTESAMDNDLTLKAAALQLGFVTEAEFDRVVDPAKMVKPCVATAR
jgi:hypothetical protein